MNMNLTRFFEHDKKLLIKVIAGVILLVIAFAFYLIKDKASDNDLVLSDIPEDEIQNNFQTTAPAIEENDIIIVDIAGAVVSPSVVELPTGSRVYEAIEKAGGLTEKADTSLTNQAEILSDGQKIYIPTKEEMENGQSNTGSYNSINVPGLSQSGLININTADSTALQQLTGVGPSTAEKIITYRNENGKFNAIDDIKNVKGIGDKTFEKFKDKITV